MNIGDKVRVYASNDGWRGGRYETGRVVALGPEHVTVDVPDLGWVTSLSDFVQPQPAIPTRTSDLLEYVLANCVGLKDTRDFLKEANEVQRIKAVRTLVHEVMNLRERVEGRKYHLHVCIDLSEHTADSVRAALSGFDGLGALEVICESDGWHSWGDPLGVGGNNFVEGHLVVAGDDPEVLRRAMKVLHVRGLHAELRPWWVITEAADWSQVIDHNVSDSVEQRGSWPRLSDAPVAGH